MDKLIEMGKVSNMKRKSAKKVILIVVGILFLLLVAGYITGVFYFKKHFLFGTTINGLDSARMTVEEVKNHISENLMEYKIVIKERDGKQEEIGAEALGMEYVDDGGVEALLENQNPYKWPFSGSSKRKLTVAANRKYNKDNVDGILDGMEAFKAENVVAPANASVTDNGNSFEITPEVNGNTIKRDEMKQALVSAVDEGKTELDLEAASLYESPAILSTDEGLIAQMNQMNTLTQANITYDFVDRQYVVNRDQIKPWLVRGDDGNYALNEQAVTDYVTQMAYDTDTFGLSHQFKTTLGPTITLAEGGDYGWVIDKETTTQALVEALKSGSNTTLEPAYLYEGRDRSTNDIGGTYAEICITQQKMWVYKDGQLVVETPVITGNEKEGFNTPSGSVWAIDAKKPDAHFGEANVDVKYWLPFLGGVGLHDASWRTPEMYNTVTFKENGSHGCVNTPIDAMAKAFDALEIGDPVIVYYSTDQVVGPQPTQENTVG